MRKTAMIFVFLIVISLIFGCSYIHKFSKPIEKEIYIKLCTYTVENPEQTVEIPNGFLFVIGRQDGDIQEWFEILASRPPLAILVRQTQRYGYILMEAYFDRDFDGIPDYYRSYKVKEYGGDYNNFYTDQPTDKMKSDFTNSVNKFLSRMEGKGV